MFKQLIKTFWVNILLNRTFWYYLCLFFIMFLVLIIVGKGCSDMFKKSDERIRPTPPQYIEELENWPFGRINNLYKYTLKCPDISEELYEEEFEKCKRIKKILDSKEFEENVNILREMK